MKQINKFSLVAASFLWGSLSFGDVYVKERPSMIKERLSLLRGEASYFQNGDFVELNEIDTARPYCRVLFAQNNILAKIFSPPLRILGGSIETWRSYQSYNEVFAAVYSAGNIKQQYEKMGFAVSDSHKGKLGIRFRYPLLGAVARTKDLYPGHDDSIRIKKVGEIQFSYLQAFDHKIKVNCWNVGKGDSAVKAVLKGQYEVEIH